MARLEDVLDLYQQAYHPERPPERPVGCFDETSRQLTGEVRPPLEAAPDGWHAMTPSTSATGPVTCS